MAHPHCNLDKQVQTYTQNIQYLLLSTATIVTRKRLNVTSTRVFPVLQEPTYVTPRATKLVQSRVTTKYRARQKGRKCKWITAHRASANQIQEATAAEPVKAVIGQVFASKYDTTVSRCNTRRSRLETLAKQINYRCGGGDVGCRNSNNQLPDFKFRVA